MTEVAVQQPQERGPSYRDVQIAQVGGGGMLLPQTFGDAVAFSTLMARSQHAIPRHLRDNPGACLAVTMQALRWGMDPFLVAAKSYSVNDMVAYESQLVNAVVNTRAPIRGRLKIAFEGTADDRVCVVTGLFEDGTEQVYGSPPRKLISPKNSPLWKTDPDQQHAYNSTRAWARRFCPEVLLGVYADDELADHHGPDRARDVTPPRPALADRLTAGKAQGFDAASVDSQTAPATVRIVDAAPASAPAAAEEQPKATILEPEASEPATAHPLPQPVAASADETSPSRTAPANRAASPIPPPATPLPMMTDLEFGRHVDSTMERFAVGGTKEDIAASVAAFEAEIRRRGKDSREGGFQAGVILAAHKRWIAGELTTEQAVPMVEKALAKLVEREGKAA